jgi:hypothetical protein
MKDLEALIAKLRSADQTKNVSWALQKAIELRPALARAEEEMADKVLEEIVEAREDNPPTPEQQAEIDKIGVNAETVETLNVKPEELSSASPDGDNIPDAGQS